MTREETKKCIEVMQAYVDGKVILGRYSTIEDPIWEWDNDFLQYCVESQPKIVPFDTIEEIADAINKHGNMIKCKQMIMTIKKVSIIQTLIHICTDDNLDYLSETLCSYTFLDGTPFGKIKR
jgi:hypothetical protein